VTRIWIGERKAYWLLGIAMICMAKGVGMKGFWPSTITFTVGWLCISFAVDTLRDLGRHKHDGV
jgi:hypothetical protein